jgi:hypothetical protein
MTIMQRHAACLILSVAALCAGCTGVSNTNSRNLLIPNDALNVSRSLTITAENFAVGAALFMIIDPLAPNWQIEQTRLDAGRYLIALKKKRFTTGGDGEAAQVFYRRAAQLAREQGNGNYRVVGYTEGIESSVPLAQRVAHGWVEIDGMAMAPVEQRDREAASAAPQPTQ